MAMEAIGIKSYNTYRKTLTDLIDYGFIIMVEKSKNQYSSNIVALSNFDEALDKALDKALTKHLIKQSESTIQSNDSIDKQQTINLITNNNIPIKLFRIEECLTVAMNDARWVKANNATTKDLNQFNDLLEKRGIYEKNPLDYKTHFANWNKSGKKELPPEVNQLNEKIRATLKNQQ